MAGERERENSGYYGGGGGVEGGRGDWGWTGEVGGGGGLVGLLLERNWPSETDFAQRARGRNES